MSLAQLIKHSLLIICLTMSTQTLAASAEEPTPATEKTPLEEDTPVAPATSKPDTSSIDKDKAAQAKENKQGDIFAPSEEISEDFAVSFPVDI